MTDDEITTSESSEDEGLVDEEEAPVDEEVPAAPLMDPAAATRGDPEYVERLNEYRALVERNLETRRALAQRGIGLDPISEIGARLELLIEALMPQGGSERLGFEYAFQRKVETSLTEATQNVNKMILQQNAAAAAGTPGTGLLLPRQG